MRICLCIDARLPVREYGGTERVVWGLAGALARAGHEVTLVARQGTRSSFARVIERDRERPLAQQLPGSVDLVHFHGEVAPVPVPYLVTQHGNVLGEIDPQSVFVSRRHAANHGSECFVHNGLDWSEYPEPALETPQEHCHFLGKAAWRVKNLRGAIAVTKQAGEQLVVMGGSRVEFRMGIKINLARHVRFLGMVGDREKARVIAASRGLVFPVTWHEPFGLAVIESLYYGCPVFATPYGALPELVTPDLGVLSAEQSVLAEALHGWRSFDRGHCHDVAAARFNAQRMAGDYLVYYQRVLDGERLNPPLPPVTDRFRDLPWS